MPVLKPVPVRRRIPNWDLEHRQEIVSNYKSYKWSVYLYKVTPESSTSASATTFQAAASYLNAKFPYSPDQYHASMHKTEGFIKGDSYATFLVLHNAAGPDTIDTGCGAFFSSTTFGYYEAGNDEGSEEITWKTLVPGQQAVVEEALRGREIVEVGKWGVEMKASEKRFHRAYWLAANMRPLGGLLNRSGGRRPVFQSGGMVQSPGYSVDGGMGSGDGGWSGTVVMRHGRGSGSGGFKGGTGLTEGMHFEYPGNEVDEDMLDSDDLEVGNDGIDISMEDSRLVWKQVLEDAKMVYE
ncbi:hypothetical protein K491DRAFT_697157 [Lophiostoma macrostomum CBS 122681]|uniref:Uncharacterized protein n=1 Tax=Lophiostoma macrostomum CBS 122681 TaxID=1314788 RepID=A0A6A6SUD9_9PLEO|nr:hypothetical protein K491DRAFT_697157 [Lophiostoma macrostomum CBS 122681]